MEGGGEKRKESTLEGMPLQSELKIACKLEISLSASFGFETLSPQRRFILYSIRMGLRSLRPVGLSQFFASRSHK